MGGNFSIGRAKGVALGGFDETMFMYGEDWDICYRARQMGWQVYLVPDAEILHHENASAKQASSGSPCAMNAGRALSTILSEPQV